jgi:hypothetical protein
MAAGSGWEGWGGDGQAVSGGGLQYTALGFGLEYGVIPWASLFARWQPGLILSGSLAGPGSLGPFADLLLGARLSLLGDNALLRFRPLRLSLSLQVKAPLPAGESSAAEPDTHLWGAGAALSLDYIPLPWFQVNGTFGFLYNPRQPSNNPRFLRQTADHPFDLSGELEPRFTRHTSGGGFSFILPLAYSESPESSVPGFSLNDRRRLLSLGAGYIMAVRKAPWPFELRCRLLFPLYGVNESRIVTLSLSCRVDIPVVKEP